MKKETLYVIMDEKKILIRSSAGVDISAAVHYPKKQSDRLAILVPGYLDSKDYVHLVMLAEDLSHIGYTAVRFDPAGTWESEGDISEYTIARELDDVGDIISFMLREKTYSSIALAGHSRGGAVSILYAARDPRISAVCAIMAPPALRRVASDEKIARWKKDGFRASLKNVPDSMNEKVFRVPYAVVEESIKYDLPAEVGKLHIPLLLIAGDNDEQVLPRDVKKIYELAHEPKKFISLKGVGHVYRRFPEQIKMVNEVVLAFLE